MMENKDKFWMVAAINGKIEMICDIDNQPIKYSSQKDASQAAKDHALKLGPTYQCAVLEAVYAEIGKMITERIIYQSSSKCEAVDAA
jgi:hypothetical protein